MWRDLLLSPPAPPCVPPVEDGVLAAAVGLGVVGPVRGRDGTAHGMLQGVYEGVADAEAPAGQAGVIGEAGRASGGG